MQFARGSADSVGGGVPLGGGGSVASTVANCKPSTNSKKRVRARECKLNLSLMTWPTRTDADTRYSSKSGIPEIEREHNCALWATHPQPQHIKKCSYLLVGVLGGWQTVSVPVAHPRVAGHSATDRSAGQPLSATPPSHTAHASAPALPRSLRILLACHFPLKMCGVNCTSATHTLLRAFLYTNFISIHLKYV